MDNNRDNNRDPNRPEQGPGKQGPNKNHQSILAFLICLIVTLVCFSLFTNMLKDGSSEITYDKFIEMVEKDQIKEVILEVGSRYDCSEKSENRISGADILHKSDGR